MSSWSLAALRGPRRLERRLATGRLIATCSLAGAGLLIAHAAFAHAVCGARVFPVPLTMDDPGVADEASIPTFIYQTTGSEEGPGRTHEYDFNFEYDKRITTNLGLAI